MSDTHSESSSVAINVLSIDAWADGEDGWTWNNWHKVGTTPLSTCDLDHAAIVAYMIEEGYLHTGAAARVAVEDDQYNLVIVDAETHEPLFALEYGPATA
jgi:hypothetical protein